MNLNQNDGNSGENVILSMFHGMWQNRCLSLVIGFKIPELLCNTEKPVSIDDIALKIGCSSSKQLYTIMRVLAQWGIGKELEDKRFTKNQAMELLRRDKGSSLGHLVDYFCSDEHFTAMRSLANCVRQDEPAFILEHGMNHFEYMNEVETHSYEKEKMFEGVSTHPIGSTERRREFAENYQRAMETFTNLEIFPDAQGVNTVYTAFPWSSCNTLVDVGGCTGHFLATILKEPHCEHIQGYVVDLPEVIDKATSNSQSLGILDHRLQFVKQDLIASTPRNLNMQADTIMCKNFIGMFWEDQERFVKVLQNSRSLFKEDGGRLLIIEPCAPDVGDVEHNIGANGLQHGFISIHWADICCGRYHSKSEWVKYLQDIGPKSGYHFNQVYETFSGGYNIFELSTVKLELD